MAALSFEIQHRDTTSHARLGRVTTPHGTFDTPRFMPVGTQASIKGLLPDAVGRMGAQIVLANTYHLMLRPGSELIARMGGLHGWMRWDRPILTDSGGFQVFSFTDANKIDDDGVTFASHLDGKKFHMTPEMSMRVQNELGADIIMAFDDCPPAPQSTSDEVGSDGSQQGRAPQPRHAIPMDEYEARLDIANERTVRWLERCVASHGRPSDQALFGIVQGGVDLERRSACAQQVCQFDLPGFAIGGVAVGEGYDQLKKVCEHTAPLLPEDKPRYLMGVGYERDILAAVRSGVDMFDCVLPTRNGRNGYAFTSTGPIKLRNAKHSEDDGPIEPGCDCPACAGGYSRSYLRHLFLAGEMLGPILVSSHNIRHFQRYLLDIRTSIGQNDWSLLARNWPVAFQGPPEASA